jgi:hypothetical protein
VPTIGNSKETRQLEADVSIRQEWAPGWPSARDDKLTATYRAGVTDQALRRSTLSVMRAC